MWRETSPLLRRNQVLLSVGYRTAYATKGYIKSRLDHNTNEALHPQEWIRTLDVAGTYAVTDQLNVSMELPIVFNKASLMLPPGAPFQNRHSTPTNGVGDFSIIARYWLLKGEKHPYENLSLGFGFLFPTGNFRYYRHGPNILGEFGGTSTTIPGLLPGLGGFGQIYDFQAYKTFRWSVLRDTVLFANGAYVSQPRNTTHTPSDFVGLLAPFGFASNPVYQNALVFSVPDTYVLTAGVATPPLPVRSRYVSGLRPTVTFRMEGARQKDIFGRSDGYRQPGYFMAFGPGAIYSYGRNIVTVEVPIVFTRNIRADRAIPPGDPFNIRTGAFVAPVGVIVRLLRLF